MATNYADNQETQESEMTEASFEEQDYTLTSEDNRATHVLENLSAMNPLNNSQSQPNIFSPSSYSTPHHQTKFESLRRTWSERDSPEHQKQGENDPKKECRNPQTTNRSHQAQLQPPPNQALSGYGLSTAAPLAHVPNQNNTSSNAADPLAQIINILNAQEQNNQQRYTELSNKLQDLNENLEARIEKAVDKAVDKKLSDFKTKITSQVNEVKSTVQTTVKQEIGTNLSDLKAECMAAQDKLNNIVVHTVKESTLSDEYLWEQEELGNLTEFLENLKIKVNDGLRPGTGRGSVSIKSFHRTGTAKDAAPRPMIVTLTNSQECWYAIKQGKLNTPSGARNPITKDRTKFEREQLTALYKEKEAREAKGETNLKSNFRANAVETKKEKRNHFQNPPTRRVGGN